MSEKHKAPKMCHIRRALFGGSPSAIFGRCTLGLKSKCRKCEGCEHNVEEIWCENFMKSLREAEYNHEKSRLQTKYTDCADCPTKETFEKLVRLPDCNDCADVRDCTFAPQIGEPVRNNCPLHRPIKQEAKQ